MMDTIEEEEEEETESEEEEIEELEEMTSPRISSWIGPDGKTCKGVMVVDDDDINNPGSKCQYDDCIICLVQPMTNRGTHRVSCLPCGHLYGFSCIKKWLGESRKCPQCNFVCAYKDVVPLHAPTICVRAHQKATSARYFPFTEQGVIEFKEHELSRRLDAQRKYTDDYERRRDVAEQQRDLVKQQAALRPQWDDLAAWRVEGVDAFKRQRRALTQEHEALQQRFDALGRLGDALKQRNNVMAQRYHAYEPSLKFFDAMYEHLAKEKNTELCASGIYTDTVSKQENEPSLKFFDAMYEHLAKPKNTELCAAEEEEEGVESEEEEEEEEEEGGVETQSEEEEEEEEGVEAESEEEEEEEEGVEVESEEEEEEEEEEGVETESEEEEEEDEEEEEEEEEEEDEAEIVELEAMTSPRISSWLGVDGKIYQGVMVADDDLSCQGNKCQYIDCYMCSQPMTSRGKHRLCCLPCGHLYGFSCIKKWLGESPFSGKCPQCNFVCQCKDVVLLHASNLCVRAHQKATSARYFPFTEQGFIEFEEHEWSRRLDAHWKHGDDYKWLLDVVEQQRDLVRQQHALKPQWDDLKAWGVELGQRAEKLGQRACELEGFDAFNRQRRALTREHEALQRRFDALGRLAEALRRRNKLLAQRYYAYEPNLEFFNAMYKEHSATQKNSEPCTARAS